MTLKIIIIGTLILTGIQFSLDAQETISKETTCRFETICDANLNFHSASTQLLSEYFITPSVFNESKVIGVFATPLIGFQLPNSRVVSKLLTGYENRKSLFDAIISHSDFPTDLKCDLDYISIEPRVRFTPFKSYSYLYPAPRFAFIAINDSTYQKPISLQDNRADTIINETLCNTKKSIILVDFHPYFGQDQRSIESWETSIVRAGIGLIFGRGLTMTATEKIDD